VHQAPHAAGGAGGGQLARQLHVHLLEAPRVPCSTAIRLTTASWPGSRARRVAGSVASARRTSTRGRLHSAGRGVAPPRGHRHPHALAVQVLDEVAADEAGATQDQDAIVIGLLLISIAVWRLTGALQSLI
jgi:hypothetical protein